MQRICVFCGSRAGDRPIYTEAAQQLGRVLVQRGLGLVYGGGHIGLMGVLADAVLQTGGEVIGVIPQALRDKELAHGNLTQLQVVDTMHQRKARMAELSDAFIALPGGYGTGDEFFEILTWAQLRLHSKPMGVLNVAGFFDGMLAWMDHMVAEGFLRPKHRALLQVHDQAEGLLDLLSQVTPPEPEPKWD
jgi:uncharacterized protein (TIGR00730 family)